MKKILLHNFGLKITTFICAFIFWQLIVGVADPIVSETFRDVPVLVINEEVVTNQGKVYQIIDGSTVSVVVKGKTSTVRSIRKEDLIAVADFEAIELSSLIPITVNVNGLNKGEVETSATPTNLKVSIEDSVTKKFPIGVSTVGEVDEGYVIAQTEVLTESVTISGPESIIEEIVRIEARIDVDNLKEGGTLESELLYFDANDVAIEQTLLNNELKEPVYVKVDIYTIKTLPLVFETSGEPAEGYNVVEIVSEPYEVAVYGEVEILDKYEVFEIEKSALNIEGMSGKVEKVITLAEYVPEGLYLLDANTTSVAVTVQLDKYGTRSIEMPVQSITVHNNPTKFTFEYYGVTDVMLTFTGNDKVLDTLSPDNITMSIDLKPYDKLGEYDVKVNVKTTAQVELLNDIRVPIKITKN